MKKYISGLCIVLVLWVIALPASGAPAHDGGAAFKDIEETEWMLTEYVSAGKTVRLDRPKIEAEMGKIYVIYFLEEGRLSGIGAPNRFNAPYSEGANRSLSIGNIASTMMLAFREPDDLKERDYFGYLSGVTRWDLRDGRLELYSIDANGTETVLVFSSEKGDLS